VGHAPENITVVGTVEELINLPSWTGRKLGLTVQTTAHRDAFAAAEKAAKEKWPHIKVFNTICDATNRLQTAVMDLAPTVNMFLVVGSETSANSGPDRRRHLRARYSDFQGRRYST
jgi:4-hydroxy-3-methylbut-2-enyl diphosphate reductase